MSYRRRKCATHTQKHRYRGKGPDWSPQVRCSGCSGFPPYKTKGNRNERLLQRCTSSIFCKCIKYMYLIRVGQKRNQTISESEPKACNRLLASQHFVSLSRAVALQNLSNANAIDTNINQIHRKEKQQKEKQNKKRKLQKTRIRNATSI